jgi:hypothetical protein
LIFPLSLIKNEIEKTVKEEKQITKSVKEAKSNNNNSERGKIK